MTLCSKFAKVFKSKVILQCKKCASSLPYLLPKKGILQVCEGTICGRPRWNMKGTHKKRKEGTVVTAHVAQVKWIFSQAIILVSLHLSFWHLRGWNLSTILSAGIHKPRTKYWSNICLREIIISQVWSRPILTGRPCWTIEMWVHTNSESFQVQRCHSRQN
jgi:hypothetical protein